MKNIKLNFTTLGILGVINLAHNVHQKMTANTKFFAKPVIAMEELLLHIQALEQAQAKMTDRSKSNTVLRNDYLTQLQTDLRALAAYVESISMGDLTTILASGFSTHTESVAMKEVFMPEHLRVRYGKNSGEFRLLWNRVPGALNYILDYQFEPPNDQAWKLSLITHLTKHDFTNLTPGATIWVRVKAIGRGKTSVFSAPLKAIVV